MYAISHAATALVLKKKFPSAGMLWLLVSVQFIELLWVMFNFLGIEHFSVQGTTIHLGYLAWSHSILATLSYAAVAWVVIAGIFRNRTLALAVSLGIVSHIILDLVTHEQDIWLTPFSPSPAFGLDVQAIPLLGLMIELSYGILCWWYFKGRTSLLVAIVIMNLLDAPLMFHGNPRTAELMSNMPLLLPGFIMFQILYTWFFVWLYSRAGPSPA